MPESDVRVSKRVRESVRECLLALVPNLRRCAKISEDFNAAS
jgi:hypothetical protein